MKWSGGSWNASYSGGGGGGVTIYPPGVPGGISMGMGSNGISSRFDSNVSSARFRFYLPKVMKIIKACPSKNLHLHGGGGGGGGITVTNSPKVGGRKGRETPQDQDSQDRTYNLGYFYFYFSDASGETGSDAESCSHIPCAQWRSFAKYIRGGPCANVTCPTIDDSR
mmetsp:Transcript_25755/g.50393  ORF Transcript_25755/g.50393 Transcript_25755/m.50393 type:complete len:167 (-) Transcript_25755:143-643(-)